MARRGWCTSPSATAHPPFPSRQAQLESGVRGNVPAPFGAGERLQSPTYRYPTSRLSKHFLVIFQEVALLSKTCNQLTSRTSTPRRGVNNVQKRG